MQTETFLENPAWPVIVHQLSSGTDLVRLLRRQKFKVRNSVTPGSLIFPLSGVAFIVVPLSHATSTDPETRQIQLTAELTDRLDKLHQTHRNCYCLCQAPLHGQSERRIFSLMQKSSFLDEKNREVVITRQGKKALCKPTKDVLCARLDQILSEYESRDFISAALKHLGLDSHQINVLEDSIGSLANLSTATPEELLDYLDTDTASRVHRFFSKEEE